MIFRSCQIPMPKLNFFFKRDQSIYVRNHARYCNHRPHPDTTIPSSEHTRCGYMVYWTGSVPPVKVTLHESTRWGAPLPFNCLLVRKIISCANATICHFISFIYLFIFILNKKSARAFCESRIISKQNSPLKLFIRWSRYISSNTDRQLSDLFAQQILLELNYFDSNIKSH